VSDSGLKEEGEGSWKEDNGEGSKQIVQFKKYF